MNAVYMYNDGLMDLTWTLGVTAVSLAAVAAYYHIKAFSFWRCRGIDGPTPWPFFGTNVYYFFWNKLDVDTEWNRRYGPTFGIYEGYWPVLRTADSEIISHIWIKDFQSWTDRNNNYIHGDVMKKWLLWSEGDVWSNQRALITPFFTSAKMKTMYHVMLNCKNRFMDEMSTRLRSNSDNQKFNEPNENPARVTTSKDDLMALTLDLISQGFFGLKMDTYKDKTTEFYQRAYAFSDFSMAHFMLWLMTPGFLAEWFQLDSVNYSKFEYFDKLTMSLLNERRKTKDNGGIKRNNLIDNLMSAKIPDKYQEVYSKEDDTEAHYNASIDHHELENINKDQTVKAKMRNFSDVEIRGQTTFFFLAGFETTSSTLSLCVFELAHQQAAQGEIYEELKSIIGTKTQLDFEDLINLKTLEAFISEVLRLYSPVIEHNRKVTNKNGCSLPNNPSIRIPYNCAVSVNGFILQRMEEYWPNPLKFDMTRFYPENRHKIKSGTYMPFGIGPRNCVGMRFALLLIRTYLAHLVLEYRVLPGSGEYPPKFNRHGFFLHLNRTDVQLEPRH